MEGRIFDRDWSHYDFRHAVFEPHGMRAEELQAGADWVNHRFYSPWGILKRAGRWLTMPHGLRRFFYPLALNLAYYGRTRRLAIRGYDPAPAERPKWTLARRSIAS
jgi:hypothetical protein